MATVSTTAARAAEADRVEAAMQWALAEISAGLLEDAIATWAKTPVKGGTAATYDDYLRSAKALVKLRRNWLVKLAVAYYRLIRALQTGRIVPGLEPDKGPVSVESLRNDFDAVLDEIERHVGTAPSPTVDPGERPKPPALRPEDDDPLETDELDEEWDKLFGDIDDKVDDQLDELIRQLGEINYGKEVEVIDAKEPDGDERDRKREDAHNKAGRRTAAEMDRISKLYARDAIYRSAEYDKLAIGWVRYSMTGTPCGFCAMLISRGVVYKSQASAQGYTPDQFHSNCQCRALPVFSMEQYDNSPLFDLNREYNKLWPKVTEGYGGKDALSKWRKYFREQEKKTTVPEAA